MKAPSQFSFVVHSLGVIFKTLPNPQSERFTPCLLGVVKVSLHLGLCPVSIKVLHGSWLNSKCPCIGYFSLGCDKAPDTGSLGRKAILPCSQGMQPLAVVAGAGAAGHTVLAVRKQRRWRLVSAAFPLLIQCRVKRHRCELYSSPSVKPF